MSITSLTACSSSVSSQKSSAGGVSPPVTSPSTPSNSPSAGVASGIAAVQMASALSPDGSALNPVTVFHHETDSKIIAVLTVSGLATGTKLSYVRYLDGKYVDSKSAQVTKPATYFYFYFTALPGKTLAVGQYRLKLYVNESSAREVSYQVQ